MIVHHQDGSKMVIALLVKAVRTKQNKIILCYRSPQSGGKGLVEFSGEEVTAFLAAMQSTTVIDDTLLMRNYG